MLVERLLTPARERLVTIADGAPMIEAAKLLRTGTDLVVVCGPAGLLAGVITKTDVVGQISHCQGASCTTAASLVMTRDVLLCRTGDRLRDVWARMKERSLKNIPVVDQIPGRWECSMHDRRCKFSWRKRKTKRHCYGTM